MTEQERSKISRRDFTKMTAAAGVAVLAGPRPSRAQDNVDTLRVGLLGCGGRGSGAAEQMLEGNENVKLIALADLLKRK